MTQREGTGPDTEAIRDLAVELARGGGELLRRAAGTGQGLELLDGSGLPEVVADVERRIVHTITARHRGHAVLARLAGYVGEMGAPVVWVVEPLDGTGNFLIGHEVYGVSIAVVGNERVVAVLHDAVAGRTVWAATGLGIGSDLPEPVVAPADEPADAVVAWHASRPVPSDLPPAVHRVLETGSPGRHWALLASGGVSAVVADTDDPLTAAGITVGLEAGLSVLRGPDLTVVGRAGVAEAVVERR